jgi:hypothetical protein
MVAHDGVARIGPGAELKMLLPSFVENHGGERRKRMIGQVVIDYPGGRAVQRVRYRLAGSARAESVW